MEKIKIYRNEFLMFTYNNPVSIGIYVLMLIILFMITGCANSYQAGWN